MTKTNASGTSIRVDFFDYVTEVIDLRSFSNLWYWIVLAMMWSTLSHWALGVPYHVVARARRGNERAAADMEALARINGERILALVEQSGPVMLGLSTFVISGLAFTGWVYRVEFCQAVFLLLCPALLVGGLTVLTARKLKSDGYSDVARRLWLHRVKVQAMGVVFIFITAFWGMYTNITVGPLG